MIFLLSLQKIKYNFEIGQWHLIILRIDIYQKLTKLIPYYKIA